MAGDTEKREAAGITPWLSYSRPASRLKARARAPAPAPPRKPFAGAVEATHQLSHLPLQQTSWGGGGESSWNILCGSQETQ